MAEGVRDGVDQPMFNKEMTLTAHPITISTSIDWYPFAAGIFDMGNWGIKVAKSFAAYIFLKALKGITTAYTKFPSAYQVAGFSVANWNLVHERVSAANGGMNVIAIGTPTALSQVNAGGNFQVAIGEKMNSVGYLDQFNNVPLIAVKNVMVPGTTNSTAQLALENDKIYMIPMAGDKPVKILFEGNEISIECDPKQTTDVRYGISINLRVGLGVVAGSKMGLITLN